ncbi:MAG TPA: DUF72 domain-containing protein, partial [Flavitalea sp.]|nr:DUF72 domain-containing protein [Flavitalea sp.]
MKKEKSIFYSGTSGLVLPVKNKLAYPEELRDRSRLHYYSTLFNTIEVNSIFYKLPQRKTVERWNNDVIDDFKFTFKLSKEITHSKELNFERAAVKRFFEIVEVDENKKGCILVQFPGKLNTDFAQQVQNLLKVVSKAAQKLSWKIAVEFRHISWYTPSTIKLLDDINAACVIHDIRPFTTELLNDSRTIYIRFHGTEKNYRGSYPNDLLGDWSG